MCMVAGSLVYVMDVTDRIISKLCPFIAGGIFVGSVYWTAVTYGAVTVMQVQKLGLIVSPIYQVIGLVWWCRSLSVGLTSQRLHKLATWSVKVKQMILQNMRELFGDSSCSEFWKLIPCCCCDGRCSIWCVVRYFQLHQYTSSWQA